MEPANVQGSIYSFYKLRKGGALQLGVSPNTVSPP